MHIIDVDLRRANGEGMGHRMSDPGCSFFGWTGPEAFCVDEVVGVFIEEGLKIVLGPRMLISVEK